MDQRNISSYKGKALAVIFGIIAIFIGCVYLIMMGVLHIVSLGVVAFGCYPLVKYVWQVAKFERSNPIRVLKNALPKCGFGIEKEDWNDEHTLMRIIGTYQNEHFSIEASPNSAFVFIYDLPWSSINSDDTSMTRFMEAVNDTNTQNPNMCVVVCDPDEKNVRQIYTVSKTILPTYQPQNYLDSLMCSMLNCKKSLADNYGRERPWLNKKRSNPIGFNASKSNEEKKENVFPTS